MRLVLCLALVLGGSRGFAAEPMRVGIVVFPGFLSSEVFAPMEVFAKAAAEGAGRFEVLTVGASLQPVPSHEGLLVRPQATYATTPPLDVLVVPSAMDLDRLLADAALIAFIKKQGGQVDYLASHCAGAFLLGKAGLLDGRRATTYIGGAIELQKRFPKARVEGKEHVVVDGNLVTSIGGAVSYEGSLALLQRIASQRAADRVADALYYFRWRERRAAAAGGVR